MTPLAPSLQAFHPASDHPAQLQPRDDRRLPRHLPAATAFAHEQTGKQPFELDIDDLDAPLIGAFLTHLEEDRGNSPDPQRQARGDPLLLPVRGARTPRTRAHDRAG